MTSIIQLSLFSLALRPAFALENGDLPRTPRPLVDHPACQGYLIELYKTCGVTKREMRENDFTALICAQDLDPNSGPSLTRTCEQVLWSYKLELTKGDHLVAAVDKNCKLDREKFSKCEGLESGKFVSCIIDLNLGGSVSQACENFLSGAETVIFSDYRMIGDFAENCKEDIEGKLCGSVSRGIEGSSESLMFRHSQGTVINCLMGHLQNLTQECRHQTMRLAELQSNDYHLDRALYFACKEDREVLCPEVTSGKGRVYTCLFENAPKAEMSENCQKELHRRQEIEAADFKADYGFLSSCSREIVENDCENVDGNTGATVATSRSWILTCLTDVIMNEEDAVSAKCKLAIEKEREQLMSDYSISLDLVADCEKDIQKSCSNEIGPGKTIHCLMKTAMEKKLLSGVQCEEALSLLMMRVSVSSNWKVDPVLKQYCMDVVIKDCSIAFETGDQGAVMDCLFKSLEEQSSFMTDECGQSLSEIQYFLARDFKLSPRLFKACKSDAKRICHAVTDWHKKTGYDASKIHVFPCLVRYLYLDADDDDNAERLSPGCHDQVRNTLRRRARSFGLHPELEEKCRSDLAMLQCHNVEEGQNMLLWCLQDHIPTLSGECKTSVVLHTRLEAHDANLNPVIRDACAEVIEDHCSREATRGSDDGELFRCLLTFKESMEENEIMNPNYGNCRDALHHWQVIANQDVSFSVKFWKACKRDAKAYCDAETSKFKWKLVSCLSGIMVKDVRSNAAKKRISKSCRNEVKFQLIQKHSDVTLNPEIEEKCQKEIKTLCTEKSGKRGAVLECLKSAKHKNLSTGCRSALFVEEKEEAVFNDIDQLLVLTCKKELKHFCPEPEYAPNGILSCLKMSKDDPLFGSRCRDVVRRRTIQQSKDYRLNFALESACAEDVKNCPAEVRLPVTDDGIATDFADPGKVLDCLVTSMMKEKGSVSDECRQEVESVMRMAAVDFEADPILLKACPAGIDACKKEIDWKSVPQTGDRGKVEDCLKATLETGVRWDGPECTEAVAKRIELATWDLSLDPLLKNVCAVDLNMFCVHVPVTGAQQAVCLSSVMTKLRPACREALEKRLSELSTAVKFVPVDGFQDLYVHLVASPRRTYFVSVALSLLFLIFIFGLLCGRATRRARKQLIQKVR